MSENLRRFIGRERELQRLSELKHLKIANLVVIKGRRRIGKSRLAEEFGRSMPTLNFLGLAPSSGVDAQEQRQHFARQLESQLNLASLRADDWDDLLTLLGKQTSDGPILIILDEINWMGSKDPTFLPKLQTAWDAHFSKNPQPILILSGSMSGWIEKHIIKSTGFFGRITLNISLDELPLAQCAKWWNSHYISSYEKFKILSVTGGIPRYLELIDPTLTAEENINRLCFEPNGYLFHEFDQIFTDLFARRSGAYREIVLQLVDEPKTMEEVFTPLNQEVGGVASSYLEDLVKTGYLARDYTWSFRSGKRSKLSRYRLKDNYLRFYLRYIEPNRELIQNERMRAPRSWYGIMGLQFKNLVLNHRTELDPLIGVDSSEIIYDNPFFQKKGAHRRGCQIDYLIQTKFPTLYICEIKFSQNAIGPSVIDEMQEKMDRLVLPKGFSLRPVLIHVNGVSDLVAESGLFSKIVDFGELLKA